MSSKVIYKIVVIDVALDAKVDEYGKEYSSFFDVSEAATLKPELVARFKYAIEKQTVELIHL